MTPHDTEQDSATFAKFVETHARRPVRYAAFGVLFDFVKAMNTKNIERNARLDGLEQRLAQLEAQPQLKYCGVWQRDLGYRTGSAATHHGSLWIAKTATTSEPGTDDSGWQLAAKRGRDGRDARS